MVDVFDAGRRLLGSRKINPEERSVRPLEGRSRS
jgi:hypothetical protein